MERKFPKTWHKESVQNAIQVQILYFHFSIPFQKSRSQQVALQCREGQHLLQTIQNLFSISLGHHPLIQ